jgi:hypothetical protein
LVLVVFDDAEQGEIIKSKIHFLSGASYTVAILGPLVDALLKYVQETGQRPGEKTGFYACQLLAD